MSIDTSALLRTNRFPPSSRYFGIATSQLTTPDGRQLTYLRRRFTPDPAKSLVVLTHLVRDQSERLDNLAAEVLGDPLQFWRICDANRALRPADLVQVGATVRIALPEGVMGLGGA